MNNNSLDNFNSINNNLWNIEISYNKQTSYFIAFLTGMFYQNYSNVFVILNYKTAENAVYLFTQNYTQTAIIVGEINN